MTHHESKKTREILKLPIIKPAQVKEHLWAREVPSVKSLEVYRLFMTFRHSVVPTCAHTGCGVAAESAPVGKGFETNVL